VKQLFEKLDMQGLLNIRKIAGCGVLHQTNLENLGLLLLTSYEV